MRSEASQRPQETAHGQPRLDEVAVRIPALRGTHVRHQARAGAAFLEQDLQAVGQIIDLLGGERRPELLDQASGAAGMGADEGGGLSELEGASEGGPQGCLSEVRSPPCGGLDYGRVPPIRAEVYTPRPWG